MCTTAYSINIGGLIFEGEDYSYLKKDRKQEYQKEFFSTDDDFLDYSIEKRDILNKINALDNLYLKINKELFLLKTKVFIQPVTALFSTFNIYLVKIDQSSKSNSVYVEYSYKDNFFRIRISDHNADNYSEDIVLNIFNFDFPSINKFKEIAEEQQLKANLDSIIHQKTK